MMRKTLHWVVLKDASSCISTSYYTVNYASRNNSCHVFSDGVIPFQPTSPTPFQSSKYILHHNPSTAQRVKSSVGL